MYLLVVVFRQPNNDNSQRAWRRGISRFINAALNLHKRIHTKEHERLNLKAQ